MAMASTEPPAAGSVSSAEEVDALTQIYCRGPILAAVQRARIWPDSKDFLDTPTRARPSEVLAAWEASHPRDDDDTRAFVAEWFAPGPPDPATLPRPGLPDWDPRGPPSRASASPSGYRSPAATTTSSPSSATSASRCTTCGPTSRARPPRTRRTRTRPPSSPPRTSPSFPASVSARRTTGIPTGPSSASSPAACSKPPRASCETCSPSSNVTASCPTARDDTISTDRNRPC